MRKSFRDEMDNAPQAYSVVALFCENPCCNRVHVALLDEDDHVIAQFVCPDPNPDGTGFFNDLKSLLYRSAVERDGGLQ